MSVENPPAFPSSSFNGPPGMTLRDWFAGQADTSPYDPYASFKLNYERDPTVDELAEYIAAIRFAEADAMLAQRSAG